MWSWRSSKLQTTNLYWKLKRWSIERIAFLILEAKANWQAAIMAFFEEFILDDTYQGDLPNESVAWNQANDENVETYIRNFELQGKILLTQANLIMQNCYQTAAILWPISWKITKLRISSKMMLQFKCTENGIFL